MGFLERKLMMRTFLRKSTYYVPGKGVCIATTMPPDLWEPGHLIGEDCLIDGTQYRIHGVESYAIGRTPESPYRYGIGLLVTPLCREGEQMPPDECWKQEALL
jgi:hypothetical protein